MCDRLKVSKRSIAIGVAVRQTNVLPPTSHCLRRLKQRTLKSDATYGMLRIRAELADQGVVVSRKRIAAVIKQAHIRGVSRRRSYVVTTTHDKR